MKAIICARNVICFSIIILLSLATAGNAAGDNEVTKSIGRLIAELADPDPEVRMDAANSLAELGPKALKAVPALGKALSDKDSYVRNFAANALTEIGPKSIAALPQLMKAMYDEDPSVSQAAQTAIGAIGPGAKEAVPKLVEFQKKWESSPQESPAAHALIGIGPASIPAVAKMMSSPKKETVLAGVWILGEIKAPQRQALNALYHSLSSYDTQISEKSAMTLRSFGKAAVPVFAKGLNSSDSFVRKQSAWSLGRMPKYAKGSLKKLQTMGRRDTDPSVKAAANWAVIQIKKGK